MFVDEVQIARVNNDAEALPHDDNGVVVENAVG